MGSLESSSTSNKDEIRPFREKPSGLGVLLLVGIQLLIGLAVLVPAWMYGGVQAAIQAWLILGVGIVVGGCWIGKVFFSRSRHSTRHSTGFGSLSNRLPRGTILLLLALGLGLMQLIAWDGSSHRLISPATAEMWEELSLGGPDTSTISLYPGSTRYDLALLVLGTTAFFAGAWLFASTRPFVALCFAVALNGAALAAVGMGKQAGGFDLPFVNEAYLKAGTPFATFVNRNNAAGYLNLSLAGALGLVVWSLSSVRKPRFQKPRFPKQSPEKRLPDEHLREEQSAHTTPPRFHQSTRRFWTGPAMMLMILAAAGVVGSLSRGGWLALLGAVLVVSFAGVVAGIITRRLRRTSLLRWSGGFIWAGVVFFAAGAIVLWLGKPTSVVQRITSFGEIGNEIRLVFNKSPDQEIDGGAASRLMNWQAGLAAGQRFWRWGSGLGTYRYVYSVFQTGANDLWYYHAENQYLEAFVEGGVVGLGLMLGMITVVVIASWRLLKTNDLVFGVVGLFAVVSQAIHGFFDFGLYLPANMLLLAVLSGAVCGRWTQRDRGRGPVSRGSASRRGASQSRRWRRNYETAAQVASRIGQSPSVRHQANRTHHTTERKTERKTARKNRKTIRRGRHSPGKDWASIALATSLLAAMFFAWGEVCQVAAAKHALTHSKQALDQRRSDGFGVSQAAIRTAIERLAPALERRPHDAEAQHQLARLSILQYRAAQMQRWKESNAFSKHLQIQSQAWKATDLMHFHGRLQQLDRDPLRGPAAGLRLDPEVQRVLGQASRRLALARQQCPLLPAVHLRIAELSGLAGPASDDVVHIQRAYLLGPGNPQLLFHCGWLEYQARRLDRACEFWRSALTINPHALEATLSFVEKHFGDHPQRTSTYIAKTVPNDPQLIHQILQERYRTPESAVIRQELLVKAQRLTQGLPQRSTQGLPPGSRRGKASVQTQREGLPEVSSGL